MWNALDNLHTRMSCQVNQDLFDISMGMYDTTDKSDKKDDDDTDDKSDNTVTTVVLVILVLIGLAFIW